MKQLNEQGKNRYGLDMAYFRNLINRELGRSLENYKPSELARVLARMAAASDRDVLQEPEFHPSPTAQDRKVPEGYVLAKKDDVESAIRMMRYACHPHKSPHADDLESGLLPTAPIPNKPQLWNVPVEVIGAINDVERALMATPGALSDLRRSVSRLQELLSTHGLQRPQPPEVEQ